MCKVSNYRLCAHHIHRIKKLHFELHTLTQLINSAFGLQLFSSFSRDIPYEHIFFPVCIVICNEPRQKLL